MENLVINPGGSGSISSIVNSDGTITVSTSLGVVTISLASLYKDNIVFRSYWGF